jgi:lambda family phage portal protein
LQISAIEKAKAYYDGADVGRRGGSIRRSLASADVITGRKGPTLRAGSLDLIRNNPHARRGCEAIVSNVFGSGITTRFKRNGEAVVELDELARSSLDTTAIDVGGQMDLYGIQALMGATTVQSGESLVHRVWDRSAPFPVQFQVLEPDYLDTTRDTARTKTGGRIVQGVEFDANGRRKQYWLYTEHPGGSMLRSTASVAIDSRDVAHVYRIERAGQVRGIPWLAPVMLRVADFGDYEEAQLLRQKIAACFVGVKTDPIGAGPASASSAPDDLENIQPGSWYRASNGSTISFGTPPPITDYKDYASVSLHALAAGLGISYEALTGDLKGVNFTSGRMGRLEMERNVVRWQWHTFIPMGCDRLIQWWLEGAALMGVDTTGLAIKHTPPPREMISPEREVPARTGAMRSGQTTLVQVAAERGMDIDELLDEIEETNAMLDARGIVLDSDPRKVSNAGLTQARTGDGLGFPGTGTPEPKPGSDPDEDEDGD